MPLKRNSNLKNKVLHFLGHLKDQLKYMFLFGFAFALFGIVITHFTDFYFKYLDNKAYYSIELPVKVEAHEYKPGDEVELEMVRHSQFDMNASSIVELVLYDGTTKKEISRVTRELSVTKGDEIIEVKFTLPETLQNGNYFYQGTVNYKYLGNEKFFNFYTENFAVKNLETKL